MSKIYIIYYFIIIYKIKKRDIQKQSKSTIHDINEFKKIILLAKKLVEKNNSKLYFVYLPEYSRYKTKYDNTYYSLIKNFVTELNITFIDIHNEIFKKEKNPLKFFPFEMLGHYNIEGYKKVAESIFKLSKE